MSWRNKKLRMPKGMKMFPSSAVDLTVAQVKTLYGEGFSGVKPDPEAKEELMAAQPLPDGDDVANRFGLADTGKGKLSIPFVYADTHYPNVFPGIPQATGNCVGKAGKNTAVVLMGVESALNVADEVTGELEGYPEIPLDLQKHGIFVWEHMYGMRGHRGQGANCSRLILVASQSSGMILRKNYEGIIDFTKENTDISIKWGGRGVPQQILDLGKDHPIRNAVDVPNHETARDFVNNGFPIWVCSDLGFSDKCDTNGYARREGSWGHSWIVAGYDDRPETIQKYGCPLFLFIHDWGLWNSNTKGITIMGTNIMIPPGSFWADARLLDQCDMTALSGLTGWKRQQLPDYGGDILG